MLSSDCRLLARSLMIKHGLSDWSFGFNRRKRSLGVCKYRTRRIELSVFHLKSSDEDIRDTILHEIAHALTPGHKHGPAWKLTCIRIGARPERCGQPMEAPSRYVLRCTTCGNTIKRHRKTRKTYACSKCCNKHNGGKYSEQYKLEWQYA